MVEDTVDFREALTAVTRNDSSIALVGAADDAEEAIRLARKLRPDVVIADVAIPGGGAPRVARELTSGDRPIRSSRSPDTTTRIRCNR